MESALHEDSKERVMTGESTEKTSVAPTAPAAPAALPQETAPQGSTLPSRAPAAVKSPGVNSPAVGSQLLGLLVDWRWASAAVVLGGAFLWAYWPTLVGLVQAWLREPDYSHGFFVAPLAVFFLWARRDRFPHGTQRWEWAGLGFLVLCMAARWISARYYLEAIDGWSILLWAAGVVCLLSGWRVLWWALPSVLFLWFMVPLPFRFERALSLPLQGIATKISSWTLQLLGQPALAVGHTIHMGPHRLEIVQACSGLRIFMGIGALAFAYVAIVRRSWWERLILLVSAIPIALIANATRVVVTGLLYRYVSEEAGKKFSHDAAGIAMILLAAAMFGGVLWYMKRLLPEVESMDMAAVVRVQEQGDAE